LVKSNSDLGVTLSKEDMKVVLRNQKISFLLVVPLSALGTWLIFNRTRCNYAEHIIAVVFLLAMNTLFGFIIGLIGLLPFEYEIFKTTCNVLSMIILGYGFWFYWQFSRQAEYTKAGRTWRVEVSYLVVVAMILSLGQQFFMVAAACNRSAGDKPATEILK